MTRKDFELIANSVKQSFEDVKDFNLEVSAKDLEEKGLWGHRAIVD